MVSQTGLYAPTQRMSENLSNPVFRIFFSPVDPTHVPGSERSKRRYDCRVTARLSTLSYMTTRASASKRAKGTYWARREVGSTFVRSFKESITRNALASRVGNVRIALQFLCKWLCIVFTQQFMQRNPNLPSILFVMAQSKDFSPVLIIMCESELSYHYLLTSTKV